MIPQTYKTAYRAARLHQITPESLEEIAACLSIEERKKVDRIGLSYQFLRDLKDGEKKRRTVERRKARQYRDDIKIESWMYD